MLSPKAQAIISLFPWVLVYMFLMDLMYIINSVFVGTIILGTRLFQCDQIIPKDLNKKLDGLFAKLFGMRSMDVAGWAGRAEGKQGRQGG